MLVGVVWGIAVEIAAMNDACPMACKDRCVDNRWIGLQWHIAVQTIDEDACGLRAFVIKVNFFFYK